MEGVVVMSEKVRIVVRFPKFSNNRNW